MTLLQPVSLKFYLTKKRSLEAFTGIQYSLKMASVLPLLN
jgi:hypothetical protein